MNHSFITLYIDPGTGAMLFSVLMGIVSALFYMFQKLKIKLKFMITGGKTKEFSIEKKPYVIFSDSKRYWNVFKPICDEFESRQIPCEYWTASPDDPALNEKYDYVKCLFIGEGNKAFMKLNIMNADICLSTTPGLDVYQWKRSQNTNYYVHILHMVSEPTLYRMFGLDYYDSVLLTGSYQEKDLRTIESMRNLRAKEMKVVGCTYMDAMLERKKQYEASANIATKSDNQFNKDISNIRTVLLAPTWGVSSILNRYGEKFIQALIKTGYKIIVRPHPQTIISDPELLTDLQKKFPETEMFKWNTDNDNFKVLSESDIMISDFSGVIFDYTLIFDKPVIYADTKLDISPYDAAWIEGETWTKRILPNLGIELKEEHLDDIKASIDDLLDNEKYKKGREKIKDIAWQYQGESVKKTVDYLIQKHEKLLGDKESC